MTSKEPAKDVKRLIRATQFVHDRLIHVFGESENVDYLWALRDVIKYLSALPQPEPAKDVVEGAVEQPVLGIEITENNLWVGTMKLTPFGLKCDDIWFGIDYDKTLTRESRERRLRRAKMIVNAVNGNKHVKSISDLSPDIFAMIERDCRIADVLAEKLKESPCHLGEIEDAYHLAMIAIETIKEFALSALSALPKPEVSSKKVYTQEQYIDGMAAVAESVVITKLKDLPQPEVVTWQPIETAPKDGQEYLAINRSGQFAVCHWDYMEWAYHPDDNRAAPRVFPLSDATHWMPLPTPPNGVKVEG